MINKIDAFAKMIFDYTLTAVGTLAISPLLFYIAYRINKDDPGPIFFAHTRIGKDGKEFECFCDKKTYLETWVEISRGKDLSLSLFFYFSFLLQLNIH